MIDVIEHNVNQAVDFTVSAKEQTGKALTYQTKARKVCAAAIRCSSPLKIVLISSYGC